MIIAVIKSLSLPLADLGACSGDNGLNILGLTSPHLGVFGSFTVYVFSLGLTSGIGVFRLKNPGSTIGET